jgi:hypothetical protein
MAYTLTLTLAERLTFDWIGNAYVWADIADILCDNHPDGSDVWNEPGSVTFNVSEANAWDIVALADADTEGGHARFPCADSPLAAKLNLFCDGII